MSDTEGDWAAPVLILLGVALLFLFYNLVLAPQWNADCRRAGHLLDAAHRWDGGRGGRGGRGCEVLIEGMWWPVELAPVRERR